MAKPTQLPEWASVANTDSVSGQPNLVEPPTAKKQRGFDYREKPPRNWVNWLLNLVYKWFAWISDWVSSDDGSTVTLNANRTLVATRLNYTDDYAHGEFTRFYHHSAFKSQLADAPAPNDNASYANGVDILMLAIPLVEGGPTSPPSGGGDRLKSVDVYVRDPSSGVICQLFRSAFSTGARATLDSETTNGSGTDKTVTLVPAAPSQAEDGFHYLYVTLDSGHRLYGAAVTWDRTF